LSKTKAGKRLTEVSDDKSGSSSIGRAPAFQAGGCGFETRLPLKTLTNPGFVVKSEVEKGAFIRLPERSGERRQKQKG
jgi:hypothetical protein